MLNLPLSHSDFFCDYFEKKPLLCPAAFTENAVTLKDVDALFNTLEPDEQRLQLFLQGQIPPTHFLDDVFDLGQFKKRINKDGFFTLLQQGATCVINRAEDTSRIFKRLCADIGNFSGQTTGSNAYLSFSGQGIYGKEGAFGKQGTFGKHWDTHDVFAVQLFGKKKWQVFEPSVPFPLSHQTSATFPQPPQTDPILECILTAGDVLYIPRGWWHEVTPLDTDSLHLSIGTYPPTVRDYLLWICSTQLPASIAARKTCPTRVEDGSLQIALEQLIALANEQEKMNTFNESQRAMAQHPTEFQSALMLKKNALADHHLVSLNSFLNHLQNIDTISFKDKTLNTNAHGRRLINLLKIHRQLSWGEVKHQLADIPAEQLCQTALDLSRFELLNIHTPI